MGKASGFVADLELALTGKGAWWDRLPEDARSELEEVRKRFKAGQYTAKPYQVASAIIASGERRGWEFPSDKVLVKWLKS